jgi:uncharacterized secreted protein with C-terminal beta-propeller domain
VTVRSFLHLPPAPPTPEGRRLFEVVAQLRRGKMDIVTELTLTANAATSTLNWKGLSPQSVVVFDPKTANAAAELYGGTLYVLTANRGNDVWTVTHANNAQTDRTFQICVLG